MQVPGHGLLGPGDEQPARIGQALDAVLVQVEAADVVGGAVAVLDGPQQPQPRVAFAFELADHVHEVLQQPGPGDGAVLGHVANQQRGHVAALGRGDQGGRDLAHLGDAAGAAFDVGAAQGLHGVHDQQARLQLLHLAQGLPEVRFGGEVQGLGDGVDPVRAELDLGGGFLAGDVEDVLRGAGELGRDVQQQGRLAHAGFARQQDHGAGHQPAAEHAVQFVHAGGQEGRGGGVDVGDPAGRFQDGGGRRRPARRRRRFPQRCPRPGTRRSGPPTWPWSSRIRRICSPVPSAPGKSS